MKNGALTVKMLLTSYKFQNVGRTPRSKSQSPMQNIGILKKGLVTRTLM